MAESNREPPLCPCGFWGSPQTSGLCSKCYKEMLRRKECSSGSPPPSSSTVSSTSPVKVVVTPASPNHMSEKDSLVISSSSLKHPKDESKEEAQTEPTTTSSKIKPELKPCNEYGAKNGTETKEADGLQKARGSREGSPVKDDVQAKSENAKDFDPTLDLSLDVDKNRDPESDDQCGSSDNERPIQKNKRKCFKCKCKLDLASSEIGRCKCDYVFCELHRLPEQHGCTYDHKEKGRQEARQKMVSPKKQVGTSLKRLDSDS